MRLPHAQRGLTLVEALVSLFILSLAVTGAFALISYNLSSANDIKNGFIGSGLAQEGIEVVRNMRDADWFNAYPFGAFGTGASPLPDGMYRVAWDSQELVADATNPVLNKDASGFYDYAAGTPTIFHRSVEIQRVVPSSGPVVEIVATVRVSWTGHFGTREIRAEEHLYNWY